MNLKEEQVLNRIPDDELFEYLKTRGIISEVVMPILDTEMMFMDKWVKGTVEKVEGVEQLAPSSHVSYTTFNPLKGGLLCLLNINK